MVWVEWLQFRMKGNEGGVEQVRLRRVVCWFVGGFRKKVRSVAESVTWEPSLLNILDTLLLTKQSWRMCNGGVDDPLVWICSGNHLGDGHVLLQEVERDFAEVEVFSQLRIREKNLSQRLVAKFEALYKETGNRLKILRLFEVFQMQLAGQ